MVSLVIYFEVSRSSCKQARQEHKMDGIDKKTEPEGGAAITEKEENGLKKFDIYKQIGPISRPNNGWTKELNYISWDDREPVYDIRTWNEDHTAYGKGVTVTAGEMVVLKELLQSRNVF